MARGADSRREGWCARSALSSLCLALAFCASFAGAARVEAQCLDLATISAGSGLADVDTRRSAVLDATLSSLVGANIHLDAVQYDGLVDAQIDVEALLTELETSTGATSPEAVLQSDISLGQLSTAAGNVLRRNGQTAAAAAFDRLATQTSGLTDTIDLDSFVDLDTRDGALLNSRIDALDLVNASFSTYNALNLDELEQATVDPVTLGLSSIADAKVYLRVVEPPLFVIGPVGSTFRSAGLRAKVNLTLLSLPPIALDLAGLNLASVNLTLAKLDLVATVAPGSGTLTALDALARTATVQATPGVAQIMIGEISDEDFLDRTQSLALADLGYAQVGNLRITLLGGLVSANAAVTLRGFADGVSSTARTLTYPGPFPQTRTAATQADFLDNLLRTLLGSLDVQITLPDVLGLNAVVEAALEGVVKGVFGLYNGTLSGIVSGAASSIVNPLFEALGVRLGELDVTIEDAFVVPNGTTCDDGAFCTVGDACNGARVCASAPNTCSDGLTCTTDTCNEGANSCTSAVTDGCLVGGVCRSAGADNPGNDCQTCAPGTNTADWSFKASGATCNDGLFCTIQDQCNGSGVCLSQANPCDDGLGCTGNTCDELGDTCVNPVTTGCLVGGACLLSGANPTGNTCLACDPAVSRTAYSPVTAGTSCNDSAYCTTTDSCDGLGACHGTALVCPSDSLSCTSEVCNESADQCEPQLTNGCLIDNACVPEGGTQAENSCQVCVAALTTSDFSYVASSVGCDSDGDGLNDAKEQLPDGTFQDHDEDGLEDHLDDDDDDDSLFTSDEFADPNGDMDPADARDLDGDRIPDYLDTDDDGDGRSTLQEITDGDTYGDDPDSDTVPNWYDLDSDDDGVSDTAENAGDGDLNDDGVPDYLDPNFAPGDADDDGIPDDIECPDPSDCLDTDDDGLDDLLDDDDDGDGVLTRHERQDGHDIDTDGDTKPNHLDADDDGDTLPTREEAADPNGDGNPVDARDSDGDRLPDYLDDDDDDDGIPTRQEVEDSTEQGDSDVDGDGLPNWRDPDSDDDGIPDGDEPDDADADGVPDYLQRAEEPDAGTPPDDGGLDDAGQDGSDGEPDAGESDAGKPDAGMPDTDAGAGEPDAGNGDGEPSDGSSEDGAQGDGDDQPDAGTVVDVRGGIAGGAGCDLGGRAPSSLMFGLFSLCVGALLSRRRRES